MITAITTLTNLTWSSRNLSRTQWRKAPGTWSWRNWPWKQLENYTTRICNLTSPMTSSPPTSWTLKKTRIFPTSPSKGKSSMWTTPLTGTGRPTPKSLLRSPPRKKQSKGRISDRPSLCRLEILQIYCLKALWNPSRRYKSSSSRCL